MGWRWVKYVTLCHLGLFIDAGVTILGWKQVLMDEYLKLG